MAAITLGGTPTTTNGNLPESQLPDFDLTDKDMNSPVNLDDFKGKKIILNIFLQALILGFAVNP